MSCQGVSPCSRRPMRPHASGGSSFPSASPVKQSPQTPDGSLGTFTMGMAGRNQLQHSLRPDRRSGPSVGFVRSLMHTALVRFRRRATTVSGSLGPRFVMILLQASILSTASRLPAEDPGLRRSAADLHVAASAEPKGWSSASRERGFSQDNFAIQGPLTGQGPRPPGLRSPTRQAWTPRILRKIMF
jgi:hypothetical protein